MDGTGHRQHCCNTVFKPQWFLSWLATTALHSDTNCHCLFMTTEVILIVIVEKERTQAFNGRSQMMDNCDHRTNTPPPPPVLFIIFLYRWIKSQLFFCVQFASVESFYFKRQQPSFFLKGPCAKQWNFLCPTDLICHKHWLHMRKRCSSVAPPTSAEWHTSQATAAKAV